MQVGALGAMLCGAVIGLLMGTFVGAILLRAAVSLYNRFADSGGSEGAVPEPSFASAVGIAFVTTLVNSSAAFVGGLVIGGVAAAYGLEGVGVVVFAQLVAIPVGVLIMALILTSELPTTFRRAIRVAACYFLIAIAIGIVAGGIYMVVTQIRLV